MRVFKFGGASIESTARAMQVAGIIREHASQPLLVVISAKGKTTNVLEQIAHKYYEGEMEKAAMALSDLMMEHKQYAIDLLQRPSPEFMNDLDTLAVECEWVLNEQASKPFDYYYDQIVSLGELLSTRIIATFLQEKGLDVLWLDVRDLIKTDETYRDAVIQWEKTKSLVQPIISKAFEKNTIVITQGFIGSTDDNATVTLGREGSDYTAAVLANMMDAESVTIWKDVPSLLNADPKLFPDTVPIAEISYHEVIEMAYYGAQVIHPKTIKPLQNKQIPLFVRCFLDSSLPGTVIHHTEHPIAYPPILVLKTEQVLLQVNTRDYSFITEDNLSKIYQLFHECKIKINLIQNAAISFVACVDPNAEKLERLLKSLEKDYEVKRNEHLFLFTVRHYTQHILDEELKNRTILLEQKTRNTIQMVVQ